MPAASVFLPDESATWLGAHRSPIAGERRSVTNPPAGTLQIIDPAARQVLQTLTGLGRPRNVAFGANGATALVTNELGKGRGHSL